MIGESRLRVFENRVFRIFGSTKDGVTGEWRKLHNKEFSDMYYSSNIVLVIKSRMRWAGHVARRREEVHTGLWWENLRKRDSVEDQSLDGRIILEWKFRKCD